MNTLAEQKPMKFKKFMVVLLVSLLVLGIPFESARADIGPKPSMSFEFFYETSETLTITSGIQLQCDDPACQDVDPLDEFGDPILTCTKTKCSSYAFGYAQYNRLVITFSDGKTRESNVFGKNYFEAKYRVTVLEDSLQVKEDLGGFNPANIMLIGGFVAAVAELLMIAGLLVILGLFIRNTRRGITSFKDAEGLYNATWIIAIPLVISGTLISFTFLATLLVETAVSLLYSIFRKLPKVRLFTIILLANLITQPLLWLVLASTEGMGITFRVMVILEIVIWLVEALILFFTMRDQFRLIEALGLSFLLNGASILVGVFLAI